MTIEDAMNTTIDKDYSDEAKSLERIPDIARKTATVIIAAVGDIMRFSYAKEFPAISGLTPYVVELGSSVWRCSPTAG